MFEIKRSYKNTGYLFISPAMVFFLVLIVFPALYVLYTSLQVGTLYANSTSLGINNYARLFQDSHFIIAAEHTLIYALSAAGLHLIIGFFLAVVLNSIQNHRYRAICRTLIMLPWAITPIVLAQLGKILYNPQMSPIAALLRLINHDIVWAPLGFPKTALLAVIIIDAWNWTPYFMLMIQARIQSIDPFTYEAADVDGASAIQKWWYITLPETRKVLLTLGAFGVAASAMYFDLVWVMTGGGPAWSSEVLSTFIYQVAFFEQNFSYASAAGIILAILSIGLSIGAIALMRRE